MVDTLTFWGYGVPCGPPRGHARPSIERKHSQMTHARNIWLAIAAEAVFTHLAPHGWSRHEVRKFVYPDLITKSLEQH